MRSVHVLAGMEWVEWVSPPPPSLPPAQWSVTLRVLLLYAFIGTAQAVVGSTRDVYNLLVPPRMDNRPPRPPLHQRLDKWFCLGFCMVYFTIPWHEMCLSFSRSQRHADWEFWIHDTLVKTLPIPNIATNLLVVAALVTRTYYSGRSRSFTANHDDIFFAGYWTSNFPLFTSCVLCLVCGYTFMLEYLLGSLFAWVQWALLFLFGLHFSLIGPRCMYLFDGWLSTKFPQLPFPGPKCGWQHGVYFGICVAMSVLEPVLVRSGWIEGFGRLLSHDGGVLPTKRGRASRRPWEAHIYELDTSHWFVHGQKLVCALLALRASLVLLAIILGLALDDWHPSATEAPTPVPKRASKSPKRAAKSPKRARTCSVTAKNYVE